MSVYSRSLDQIQTSYHFSDNEMARMDYTLKVFSYELSKLCFITLFFFFIGRFEEYLICLIALLPFRWLSGGLHLQHFWTCFLFSFLFFSLIIFGLENCLLPEMAQTLFLLIANISLYVIGPVTSSKRKTMTKRRYDCMRITSSVILLIYTVAYLVMENVPHRNIIFWSIILQIIQLFCAKLARKGEIYEKA